MNDEPSPIYSLMSSDPDFQELVRLYVDEMPDRIARIRHELETKNWSELARLVHQIKGSAGSHGFDRITPAALELEQTIKNGLSEDQIAASAEKLLSLCRHVTAEPPKG